MMRPRFSLRTLLIATAILAGLCYYWIEMPRATAKRFVDAIGAEEFSVADRMFWKAGDRGFAASKEKYWGFRADAEVLPWSMSQFLSGRRDVQLHMTYFFLDEHHDVENDIAATAFGLNSPTSLSTNNSMMIDRTQMSGQILEKR
jgi:hypothetical protein